jgi:hypothetical protein
MQSPRVDDSKTKRLRARLRREANPCHLCGGAIDYTANHLDPASFQVDHKWQVSNGGPEYDYDNCASSHRGCNRLRSDTIDAIAIATAAQYGVTLTAKPTAKAVVAPTCAPDGQHCNHCGGVHNPQPDVTFVTSRNWWAV